MAPLRPTRPTIAARSARSSWVVGLCVAGVVLAGCTGGPAGRTEHRVTVDGLERTFAVVRPAGAPADTPLPLVIALHGGGGSGRQFEANTGLTAKAREAGFVVAYPDGSRGPSGLRTWNAGGCCAAASATDVDDVAFLAALIETLVASHGVDPRRVYAVGHSNGGMMAYRLACERPDRVAAVGSSAGPLMVESCTPERPVPVMHLHSALDRHVPVDGGVGTGPSRVEFPPVADTLATWAVLDGCEGPPTVEALTGHTRTTWEPCRDGSEVVLLLTGDGGHSWPGGAGAPLSGDPAASLSANDALWSFLAPHRLP